MQSNNLYYYGSGPLFFSKTVLSEVNRPDLDFFANIFLTFTRQMSFHDRSGIIKTPIRTVTVPGTEIPKYEKINLYEIFYFLKSFTFSTFSLTGNESIFP